MGSSRVMPGLKEGMRGMRAGGKLGRHRDTISSAHGCVRQVTGMTNRARRIMQGMNRREVQQRLILYALAVVIAIVFLKLVYGMFK